MDPFRISISGVIAMLIAAVAKYYRHCYNAITTGKGRLSVSHALVTTVKSEVINVDAAEKLAKKWAAENPVIKIIIPLSSCRVQSMTGVEEQRKQGNAEFTQENYDPVIECYTTVLLKFPESEKRLMSTIYLNRAATHSELKKYDNCEFDCDRTLELVSLSTNTYFGTRGLVEIGKSKQTFEDITVVIILDDLKNPTDTVCAQSVLVNLGKMLLFIMYNCGLVTSGKYLLCVIQGQNNFSIFKKHKSFIMLSNNEVYDNMKSFCNYPFKDKFPLSLMKSGINTGLELALKSVKNKNCERIEETCEEKLNKIDNTLFHRTLALNFLGTIYIYMQCGNYTTGFDYFTTANKISRVPNKWEINSLIKRASIYREKYIEKSYEDLQQVRKINPNCTDVLYHRTLIYLLEINKERAVKKWNIKFCYVQLYLYVKQILYKLNKKKLLKRFEECVVEYPYNVEYYSLNVQALLEQRNYKKTSSLLKKLYAINPDHSHFLVLKGLLDYVS